MEKKGLNFFNSIYELRTAEHIILFGKQTLTTESEDIEVVQFLEMNYKDESIGYPNTAPTFDAKAALWAAKITYYLSQFFLFREDTAKDIPQLLPPYSGIIDEASLLSADLCLRFVPEILRQLHHVDAEDPIITHVNNILSKFHYSTIGYRTDLTAIDFEIIFATPCLSILYLDRIVEKKDAFLVEIPIINQKLHLHLGAHKDNFWREINEILHV